MLSRWLQLHFLKTTDRGCFLFLASQLWSNSGFLGHLTCGKQGHHLCGTFLRIRKSHRLWVTPASQVCREASIYYLSVIEETPLHLSSCGPAKTGFHLSLTCSARGPSCTLQTAWLYISALCGTTPPSYLEIFCLKQWEVQPSPYSLLIRTFYFVPLTREN